MQFNKRGQELSVNTLILIIIGVLILVFLIVGFTIGWKKIFPFITPANNVKEVVDKCSLSCNTQSSYDFCTAKREVRVDEKIDGVGDKFTGSCYELKGVSALGVEDCPNILCKDFVYSSKKLAELSCGNAGFESSTKETQGSIAYRDADGTTVIYIKCNKASAGNADNADAE